MPFEGVMVGVVMGAAGVLDAEVGAGALTPEGAGGEAA